MQKIAKTKRQLTKMLLPHHDVNSKNDNIDDDHQDDDEDDLFQTRSKTP